MKIYFKKDFVNEAWGLCILQGTKYESSIGLQTTMNSYCYKTVLGEFTITRKEISKIKL